MAIWPYTKTNPKQLPLFWKFSIAIASTVVLFGSLNLFFIRNQVYQTFENQIEKHGISVARGIAERATEPILYDDWAALNQLLAQTKYVNPDISYIFIIDYNKKLLTHTFEDYLPKGLVDVNPIPQGEDKSIIILKDEKNPKLIIRDIAIPILGKQIGTVRIGIHEGAFLREIRRITALFLGMVIFFLILGIIGAFILSYVITRPVKAISTYASTVDLDSFNHESIGQIKLDSELSVKLKNLFNLSDEIDVLGTTFNDMLFRLQDTYKELKNAQESLMQTEKMASVGTLTAGLAHEINNPLAGIRNCIRRIENNPENIKQNVEYITMMSEALQKIEGVVEGMLNFSRKQELKFSEVNLNHMLDNSISLVKFQLEQSKIRLIKELGEEPNRLNASQNHLEQVFVNILLNSIDSINERKLEEPLHNGLISIRAFNSDDELFIEFTDNGTGVTEEKVASIFDPFFTMKKVKQGTGLGLAVSYNIVNSHNGHITGWNEASGGFTISINLPR